jgi:HlyD family secretion protein
MCSVRQTCMIKLRVAPLVLAGLAVACWKAPAPSVAPNELVSIVRGQVQARLTVIGELRPAQSTTVSSTLSGDQGKIVYLADDGAVVAQGDVLVRLDRAPFEEALRVAVIEVERREGALEVRRHSLDWERSQAKRMVDSAMFESELAVLDEHRFEKGEGPLELGRLRAEQAKADSDLVSQQRFVSELTPLLEKGFVQQAEIDQMQARLEDAQNVAELARQQAEAYEVYIFPSRVAAFKVASARARAAHDQALVSSAAKVAEAQAAVELAERDLRSARAHEKEAFANLERTTIVATTDGMLVLTEEFRNGQRRKPRVGDTVWLGQQIAFLPVLTHFFAESQVREVDLHLVAAGHSGIARFDAYPGLEIPARVRGLSVLAERSSSESGEKVFGVTIELEGSDPRLRPGMTARVEIDAGSVSDALVMPVHALWEDRQATWCWVSGPGGLQRRVVRAGLRDHHVVEILDGLSLGDEVSLVGPEPTNE